MASRRVDRNFRSATFDPIATRDRHRRRRTGRRQRRFGLRASRLRHGAYCRTASPRRTLDALIGPSVRFLETLGIVRALEGGRSRCSPCGSSTTRVACCAPRRSNFAQPRSTYPISAERPQSRPPRYDHGGERESRDPSHAGRGTRRLRRLDDERAVVRTESGRTISVRLLVGPTVGIRSSARRWGCRSGPGPIRRSRWC